MNNLYIKKQTLNDIIYSLLLTNLVIVIFIINDPDKILHWFLIPLLIMGAIISVDIIKWFRREYDIFDPRAILALLSFHFFVLAPLLHTTLDYWLAGIYPPDMPDDWRTWLGILTIINIFGYLIYLVFRSIFMKFFNKKINLKPYKLNRKKFLAFGSIFLFISFVLQIYIYSVYGGILGFIRTYSERESIESNFSNMGSLFMISESFPIIFLMLVIVFVPKKYQKSTLFIIGLLTVFVIERLYFGGLRGSRSNTVWAVFWALGIIHYFTKKISMRFLVSIGTVFLVFMMIYGVYKSEGVNFKSVIESNGIQTAISQNDRGLERLLLVDLARSDIQAYIIYKLSSENDYQLALGETYFNGLSLLIPNSLDPFDFKSKVAAGTNIQYGENTYEFGYRISSRIYGLTGEFMLNFGIVFAPLVFILLSIMVSYTLILKQKLIDKDPRKLLLPFLILVSFLFLVNDFDNMVFLFIKNLAVPFVLIMVSLERLK